MTPINDPSIVPQRPESCNQAVQDTDPASQTHIKETGRRIMSDKPRQRKEEFHVEEYYVNDMNQSDQKLETRYIYKFDPGLCSKIYRHFKCPLSRYYWAHRNFGPKAHTVWAIHFYF